MSAMENLKFTIDPAVTLAGLHVEVVREREPWGRGLWSAEVLNAAGKRAATSDYVKSASEAHAAGRAIVARLSH